MDNRSHKLALRRPRLDSWLDRLAWLEDAWDDAKARVRTLGRQAHVEELGASVQRFGGAAWERIAARWPALGQLVRERSVAARPRARARAPQKTSAPITREAQRVFISQLGAAAAWEVRAQAATNLSHGAAGHDPEAELVPALLAALRDHSVEVAVAAIEALSTHTDERALAGLLRVLENADGYFNPVTRVAAISGLARRLDPARFEPVFAALRDIDAEVSIAAVAVIADRVPEQAGALLLPVLRDRSGYYLPIVRLAVANALERTGALHVGVVGELLSSEQDPSVQRVLERSKYLTDPERSEL